MMADGADVIVFESSADVGVGTIDVDVEEIVAVADADVIVDGSSVEGAAGGVVEVVPPGQPLS